MSSSERAISPMVSRLSAAGKTPLRLNALNVGLKPKTPQYEAGRSTEPPVCVPKATGTMQSATAAPEPLEEPPGVWAVLWGFVVGPGVMPANSQVTALPRMMAPAARTSATQAASLVGRLPL